MPIPILSIYDIIFLVVAQSEPVQLSLNVTEIYSGFTINPVRNSGIESAVDLINSICNTITSGVSVIDTKFFDLIGIQIPKDLYAQNQELKKKIYSSRKSKK